MTLGATRLNRAVAAPLALLLPPSEGKAPGGESIWDPGDGEFGVALGPWRAQVVDALARCGGGDEQLFGVGGAHLLRAQSANVSLLGAPALPACRRYTGVVWKHLDLDTLTPAARRRAAASIVVVSGLLGAVRLDDPTPDYRLKMSASLPPLGKLSTWWRPHLSATLNEWLTGRTVIDLLPAEHGAAWTPAPSRFGHYVTVAFVERGGRRAVGHGAKAAKGLLARHVLAGRGDPLRALKTWHDERYELRVDAPFG